jgi:CRP-like cAMP-binding protein
LLRILELRIVVAGTHVIEQGEHGSEAYLLARGEVEVSRLASHGQKVSLARLGSGSLFGEMALLSRARRAADVVASRPCLLLVAKKATLDDLVEKQPEVGAAIAAYCHRRMIDNLIRTSSMLSSVEPRDRSALIQNFVSCSYEKGQYLITQGEEPEGLHLLASGEVAVLHRDVDEPTVIATLGAGELVGEMSLVLRRPANADVVATTPTVTLHLPSARFMDIVRAYPGVLSHLYELAIARDAETHNILVSEAEPADDMVLL